MKKNRWILFTGIMALSALSTPALADPSRCAECEARKKELAEELLKVEELQKIVAQCAAQTPGQKRKTNTGAEFSRDSSIPALGEAWRDKDGTIWGDIVKKADGSPQFMNQYQASDYCQSIGAQLPTKEDFTRLREYMGARSGTENGYTPQILPNLTYNQDGKTYSRYFWSSSVHPYSSSVLPGVSNIAYGFDGRGGGIGFDYRDYHLYYGSVRCVARR